MFFDSWEAVLRVLIMGTLTYIALIVLLRTSGKRTLSKMNMFDFVITIALGSAFSAITLSTDIHLTEGIAALALLIYLQFMVTWLSVRFKSFRQVIKGDAALLYYRGMYLTEAMRKERVTAEEIRAAARNHGIPDMQKVFGVVLETEGSLTVLTKTQHENADVLEDIEISDAVAAANHLKQKLPHHKS